MTVVNGISALRNCASDTIQFCLRPEILPVFFAWLEERGEVTPGYAADDLVEDMETILAYAQGVPHKNIETHE